MEYGVITMSRVELIARLAAVGNRMGEADRSVVSVKHIAQYITECGTEFHLSNDEQVLFLRYIACGVNNADALMRGDFS